MFKFLRFVNWGGGMRRRRLDYHTREMILFFFFWKREDIRFLHLIWDGKS